MPTLKYCRKLKKSKSFLRLSIFIGLTPASKMNFNKNDLFQRIITKGRRRSFPRNSLVTSSSEDDESSVTSSDDGFWSNIGQAADIVWHGKFDLFDTLVTQGILTLDIMIVIIRFRNMQASKLFLKGRFYRPAMQKRSRECVSCTRECVCVCVMHKRAWECV